VAVANALIPGLVGSLIFGFIMWRTGLLPRVALIAGYNSAVIGFIVHLIIGSIIGFTYGKLFRHESPDLASGASWGLVYGLIWWFLGPLTLMPILLDQPLAWAVEAVLAAFPSLLGHLLYGFTTGVGFYLLERRQKAWARLDPRIEAYEKKHQRETGSPAVAVWLFVLGMGMIVTPLLI